MNAIVDRSVPPTSRIVEIGGHAVRWEEPLVGFRLVEATDRSPAPPPAFLLGPSGAAAARAIYGQVETPQTGCYALTDAAVAPTGIGLHEGTAFCGPQLNLPPEHVATITRRLSGAALPVRFIPGPLVALFGPAEESYAQLLTDYLPRLWLLQQAGHRLETLRLLLPATLPPLVEEILAQLGLRPDQMIRYAHWEEVIRTDLLLLPTTLRLGERLSAGFGAATRFWVERVRATLRLSPPVPEQRLFVVGESATPALARLEAAAAQAGFSVIRPAGMDLAERAAAFGRAGQIVGAYGAALHDSVFAAPGATVCALRHGGRDPAFLQTGLCAAMGQSAGYLFTGEAGALASADAERALAILACAP